MSVRTKSEEMRERGWRGRERERRESVGKFERYVVIHMYIYKCLWHWVCLSVYLSIYLTD